MQSVFQRLYEVSQIMTLNQIDDRKHHCYKPRPRVYLKFEAGVYS
jgi:hypothetical protein